MSLGRGIGKAAPIVFDMKMTDSYRYIHRHNCKEPRVDFITNIFILSLVRLPSAMNFKETIWNIQICSCCNSAGRKAVITKSTWVNSNSFLFYLENCQNSQRLALEHLARKNRKKLKITETNRKRQEKQNKRQNWIQVIPEQKPRRESPSGPSWKNEARPTGPLNRGSTCIPKYNHAEWPMHQKTFKVRKQKTHQVNSKPLIKKMGCNDHT